MKIYNVRRLYVGELYINLASEAIPFCLDTYRYTTRSHSFSCYFPEENESSPTDVVEHLQLRKRLSSDKFCQASLYVVPECTISRKLLRESGYRLKLDPKSADIIVLPLSLKNPPYYAADREEVIEGDMAAIIEDRPGEYACLVFDVKHKNGTLTDSEVRYIQERFLDLVDCIRIRLGGDIINITSYNPGRVTIPMYTRCEFVEENYDALLQNTFTTVWEDALPVVPPYELTPENIALWQTLKEKSIVVKILEAGDWVRYPYTLGAIANTLPYDIIRRSPKLLSLYESHGFDNGDIVFPDDWNMMQKYYAYKFAGDAEKGGWVKERVLNRTMNIPGRIYIKPLLITEPTPLGELKSSPYYFI